MPHPISFTLRNIWTNVIDLQLEEQIQDWKLLLHIYSTQGGTRGGAGMQECRQQVMPLIIK
jgi:hypothetical protein